MSRLVIEHGTVCTLDGSGTEYSTGYVVVVDDKIVRVGEGPAPIEDTLHADDVLDATGMVVMPGLVNAHTHLFQSFIRGMADDRPLLDWLETAIFPVAAHLRAEDAYCAARLGLVENIRSGVTSVIDHQYVHTEPGIDDAVLQAADEMGIRFMHAYGWADMNYHPSLQLTGPYVEREIARLYASWNGKRNDRLRVEFAPVIPWGCSDEAVKRMHAMARQWGVGTHIHVAETREEVDMNIRDRGMRHIEWLDSLGMLDERIQLVHSVWLDDRELSLIQDSGACVVHCPVSNMYLASGAARVPEMMRLGIRVALATDGPGSNNCQDMMEVLKITALLAKLSTLDAMAVLPMDVLRCACNGGAAALGQSDRVGSIEVGKQADIILVDVHNPFAVPVHNMASALVYNARASAVDTVIVDGEVLMRNKVVTVVDEREVLDAANAQCRDLFSRAGIGWR
jgi:5-methylthioadenosine/S-adenosylhomocysteine deaminase